MNTSTKVGNKPKTSNYLSFIENKIIVAENYGFKIKRNSLPEILLDHQKDITKWSLEGGRRAVFASFGLGKTVMQLAIYEIHERLQPIVFFDYFNDKNERQSFDFLNSLYEKFEIQIPNSGMVRSLKTHELLN